MPLELFQISLDNLAFELAYISRENSLGFVHAHQNVVLLLLAILSRYWRQDQVFIEWTLNIFPRVDRSSFSAHLDIHDKNLSLFLQHHEPDW